MCQDRNHTAGYPKKNPLLVFDPHTLGWISWDVVLQLERPLTGLREMATTSGVADGHVSGQVPCFEF